MLSHIVAGATSRWAAAAAAVRSLPPPAPTCVCRGRLLALRAVRGQAVQAPIRSDVKNVTDVGLKDVPLRSLFPDEPAPPRPVRLRKRRQPPLLPCGALSIAQQRAERRACARSLLP
jgi:hypothetical protein